MNVHTLNDRIIVRRAEAVKKTSFGLIIPDQAAEKPEQGQVLCVGEGHLEGDTHRPLAVRAGDQILFTRGAGQTVKIDGEDLLVMKEDDVIAVIEE